MSGEVIECLEDGRYVVATTDRPHYAWVMPEQERLRQTATPGFVGKTLSEEKQYSKAVEQRACCTNPLFEEVC